MSPNIYLYTQLNLFNLEILIESFREDFDNLLKDSFSEIELEHFEKLIDNIAAISVQPMLEQLSFDDFYANPFLVNEQRVFFENCKSTVVLENLPFFESNFFQVSYLKLLLSKFDEVLVDKGGVLELCFKDSFLNDLSKFKTIDQFFKPVNKTIDIKSATSLDPIDFLISDVYRELTRLKGVAINLNDLSPKIIKIFVVMNSDSQLSADALLRKTGLNPKDLDDGLERLKFWLRKI
jgi:hypothetical protein